MSGIWRIRDRRSFARLRAEGTRRRSGPLTVTALLDPKADRPPRVAYAIGRRFGSAVGRNRVRRQLRAAVRDLSPVSGDYLVAVGPAAAEMSFTDLRAHLEEAFGGLGALG